MDPDREFRPWADLPTELLAFILDHLAFRDHVALTAVCKKFQDVGSKTLHFQSLNLPWLLLPPRSVEENLMWGFYSLLERRVHRLPLPLFSVSYKGWLLVTDPYDVHLFNPFTHQRIPLPSFSLEVEPYKLFLSSTSPSSSDSSAFVAVRTGHGVLYCRMGDPEWTFLFNKIPPHDILLLDDLLYCVDCLKVSVYEFDPQLVLKYELNLPPIVNCNSHRCCLVKSAGDILLVIQYTLQPDVVDDNYFEGCNSSFAAYKLDLSALRWEEVRCVRDDQMLLMDADCLRSVTVGNLSKFGFRESCIYFICWEPFPFRYTLCEFCLEDKKIVPFKLDCSLGTQLPQWFMLNI